MSNLAWLLVVGAYPIVLLAEQLWLTVAYPLILLLLLVTTQATKEGSPVTRKPDPLAPDPEDGGRDWFSFWVYGGTLILLVVGFVLYQLGREWFGG
jgi:hypothetical protein